MQDLIATYLMTRVKWDQNVDAKRPSLILIDLGLAKKLECPSGGVYVSPSNIRLRNVVFETLFRYTLSGDFF